MAGKRSKGPASVPAEPLLTVTATVLFLDDGKGGADVHIIVNTEGVQTLVSMIQAKNNTVNRAGAQFRDAVLNCIDMSMDGPPVDMLAIRKSAGRA